MKGPYFIICRGHSGSRLLAEAFLRNRLWMGLSENPQRDAREFNQGNRIVRYLIQAGFQYAHLPDRERTQLQDLARSLVERSKRHCPDPEARLGFGWKRAVTTYMCEIVLDAYPQAQVVHLVRDGRDAMLSRLDARMRDLTDPLNRLVVFGDPAISTYRDRPLAQAVEEYRNEIEMHHWVTAVRFGMRARRYSGRYREVRYEDLCRQPAATLASICDFLDLPLLREAREWICANAATHSIGKWIGHEAELAEATRIGEPLLRELGYL